MREQAEAEIMEEGFDCPHRGIAAENCDCWEEAVGARCDQIQINA